MAFNSSAKKSGNDTTILYPGASTTYPLSKSEYPTVTHWVNITQSLNVYERSFLILYEVICGVLTILLNTYLLYTILFKVS